MKSARNKRVEIISCESLDAGKRPAAASFGHEEKHSTERRLDARADMRPPQYMLI